MAWMTSLARSSVRQDLLQRTQRWRDQLRDIGDRAGDRLGLAG